MDTCSVCKYDETYVDYELYTGIMFGAQIGVSIATKSAATSVWYKNLAEAYYPYMVVGIKGIIPAEAAEALMGGLMGFMWFIVTLFLCLTALSICMCLCGATTLTCGIMRQKKGGGVNPA